MSITITIHFSDYEYRFAEHRKTSPIVNLVPYSEYKARNSIKLGLLAKGAGFSICDDFELSDSEMLGE